MYVPRGRDFSSLSYDVTSGSDITQYTKIMGKTRFNITNKNEEVSYIPAGDQKAVMN